MSSSSTKLSKKPRQISQSKECQATTLHETSVVVETRMENLRLLREFLSLYVRMYVKREVPDDTLATIKLALQEGSSNVVRYAYPKGTVEQFQVILRCSDEELSIELVDGGKPFDPDAAEEPIPGELSEGGYGIFIMKQIMDNFQYWREEGVNHLLLTKVLSELSE